MQTKLVNTVEQTIPVAKQDLIESWRLLELIVVSLRKMGSYYSVPTENDSLSPEQQAEMEKALDRFFSPELLRLMSTARVNLSKYLPDDEAESISDSLPFWEPQEMRKAAK